MELVNEIWQASGLYQITVGQAVMLVVCLVLLYLGIAKKFEPLLLVTIGFGGLLANIPGAVAQTATMALTNATLPFVLALANKGIKHALLQDIHLLNGLNVHKGMLTCHAVAEAMAMPYTEAEQAILQ